MARKGLRFDLHTRLLRDANETNRAVVLRPVSPSRVTTDACSSLTLTVDPLPRSRPTSEPMFVVLFDR